MKKIIAFVFPIFSLLLLAAHFSRINVPYLPYIFLILPFLFLWKKETIRVAIQIVLFLGGFVWIYAINHYVNIRIANGENWLRLLIILSLVSLFTFYSSYLMSSSSIKNWFNKGKM